MGPARESVRMRRPLIPSVLAVLIAATVIFVPSLASGAPQQAVGSAAAAADPTMLLGHVQLERHRVWISQGRALAFPFRSVRSGTATSISVYIAAHTRVKALVAGVYANAHGHPGKRLAAGSLSPVHSRRWVTLGVRPFNVVAGRTYWLAVLGRGGTLVLRERPHGRCWADRAAQSHLRSLPAGWRAGARQRGCPISARVDGRFGGGSTTTVPPTGIAPASLPSGVTLQQIDGGPSYFSRFSNATGWDSPNFYPIATFNQSLGYNNGNFDASQITAYKNMGVNGFVGLYNGYNQALLNTIKSNNMWAIDQPLAAGYAGSTLNGYVWFDEPEMNNRCGDVPSSAVLGESVSCSPTSSGGTPASVIAQVTADLHGAHGAGDPTRFVYGQYTKPVARGEGLSPAQASQYANAVDVISFDDYIINDGWESDHNLWEQADLVKNVRSEAGYNRPVLAFIEAGEPFTSDQWSGITATPAMSVAEAWNAIIGGARGIEWFDHDFGGSSGGYATSADDLIDPKSVFASLQAAVKAFDHEVAALAPVINSPFANNYVTAKGAVNVMAKYDAASNNFYVFVAPRSSSAQSMTFSVAGGYNGPVTVYGENRTITATGGQFTDSFPSQTAVHIYVVPNG
jgi:hypothetical protein